MRRRHAEFIHRRLQGTVEIGDRVPVETAELIIRQLDDKGEIVSIGLAVEPSRTARPKLPIVQSGNSVRDVLARWRHRLMFDGGFAVDRGSHAVAYRRTEVSCPERKDDFDVSSSSSSATRSGCFHSEEVVEYNFRLSVMLISTTVETSTFLARLRHRTFLLMFLPASTVPSPPPLPTAKRRPSSASRGAQVVQHARFAAGQGGGPRSPTGRPHRCSTRPSIC